MHLAELLNRDLLRWRLCQVELPPFVIYGKPYRRIYMILVFVALSAFLRYDDPHLIEPQDCVVKTVLTVTTNCKKNILLTSQKLSQEDWNHILNLARCGSSTWQPP